MRKLINQTNKEISELLNIDIDKVNTIKKVINSNSIDYLQTFSGVAAWVRQCYNLPSLNELRMCAINDIINGYGIESINVDPEVYESHYYGNSIAEYINMGDTYTMTIIRDHRNGKIFIQSWGDFYENLIY
jgi:hypothetical protein